MRRIAGMLAAGLLVAACGNEATGPSTSEYEAARSEKLKSDALLAAKGGPKKAPAQAAAAKAGAPGVGNFEQGYTYDPTGKRDPFRSFVLEEAAKRNKGERGPLEQFELGQISLQAVVWGTDKPRALVTDPQGRDYIVKEGTPIGKSSGVVTKIGDNMVVVRETYEDTIGGRTEKDIEMRIRQSQGG
jgi:type IV pilus assembly protein PilP